MAWPKGRKLSASHKAAISRSMKGKGKQTARRTGRAARGVGRASGAIVKRTLAREGMRNIRRGQAINRGIGRGLKGAKKLATDHPHVVGNAIGVVGAFAVINSRGRFGARASANRALQRTRFGRTG